MATEEKSIGGTVGGWPVAIRDYVGELQAEMRRVTWPNWKQVRATTTVVIVAVFAFAGYFYVVDFVVGRTINKIFNVFAR